MRKPANTLLACIPFLFLCMTVMPGMATGATGVSIVPSIQTVAPGEEFTLEVYIKPETTIAGLQFDLAYDTMLISVRNIDEKAFFESNDSAIMSNQGTINESNGTVSRVYRSVIKGSGTVEEGAFCNIELTAGYNEGNCELSITNLVVWDEQGSEVATETIGSTINIDSKKALASTADSTERDGINVPSSAISKTSGWVIFIFAVLTFSAVAYFLDRKK